MSVATTGSDMAMVPDCIDCMARCTAPVRGHRSASAAADCPACRGRYGRYGGYSGYAVATPPLLVLLLVVGEQRGRPEQRRRVRQQRKAALVASRFVRGVHARRGAGTHADPRERREASVRLTFGTSFSATRGTTGRGPPRNCTICSRSRGVKVWFSEKDVGLGVPLLRAIDKGLANSRIGIVLVTPALLRRLPTEGIADKELSALLARERLVPVVHETTYEALRDVSPLLASRSGLSTAEESMADVAAKLAELVAV